jgi:hypothetical protein
MEGPSAAATLNNEKSDQVHKAKMAAMERKRIEGNTPHNAFERVTNARYPKK